MNEQPEHMDEQHTEKAQRIAYLIAAYIRGTITPIEHDELDDWVGESDMNMKLFEELTDEKKIKAAIDWYEDINAPRALKKVKERIHFTSTGTRRIFSRGWHYAVAASLVLVVVSIAYFVYQQNNTVKPLATSAPVEQPHDLQPGNPERAILTLGNGNTIVLDLAKDGTLATEGSSNIIKENGQIVYSHTGSQTPDQAVYNTITTPRGGSYPLTLSDGTRIWLNAASSIRFPAVFQGAERRVAITGEAYFEVAKNKAMPFRVEVKDRNMTVEVLGTHFNINSYSDEPIIKTTLLEGTVKVQAGQQVAFIRPGQQAQAGGNVIKTAQADVDAVIAWKNGLFRFSNADLATIMKQVSRWYDVDIEFATDVHTRYSCMLSRNLPASKLFEVLEETGGVHFKIEGKKVKVLP